MKSDQEIIDHLKNVIGLEADALSEGLPVAAAEEVKVLAEFVEEVRRLGALAAG